MGERYDIRRKIGSGGAGAVYEAVDTLLDRKVAIKRLLPADESESPELAEGSLQKETAALSALQHPNIVTIFDVGADEDGQFVVMELIEGENIEEAVSRETLDIGPFTVFAGQALDALSSAQEIDLLHRDIKPRNLMIRWLPDGKPLAKILDFGLAKFAPKPALQTMDQNKAVLGSVFYMAPEQFERRPLDPRTDVYSLGCVFYYALSGHDPYSGSTAVEVMTAHLEHHVHHLRDYRPDLPESLADWVMWMMNHDMGDRPQNAGEALALFNDLAKRGFGQSGAAGGLSASVVQGGSKEAMPVLAGQRAMRFGTSVKSSTGSRPLLFSEATGAVVERNATTGLVPDVENRQLTRPPMKATAAAPAKRLTKATGTTGATAATAVSSAVARAGAGGGKAQGGTNRGLVWFGIGATALALVLVTGVLVASLGKSGDDRPSLDVAGGFEDDGFEKMDLAPKGLPEWSGHGGDDLFSKMNWRGGKVPKPGGEGLVVADLTRSMQRVNGALNLTVAGKLNVESYYDVIGVQKGKEQVPGFLAIEKGGEVKVGSRGKSKLVIGRMTSGWTEVRGKLVVTSILEIGDTKGTKARLTVDGGEATTPKLICGDCEWEIEVMGRGKLKSWGEARFGKGQGKIRITDGGLLRAKTFEGITRKEVEVTLDRGGKIWIEDGQGESVLNGWKEGGTLKTSGSLAVKKVEERGKTFFEISAK